MTAIMLGWGAPLWAQPRTETVKYGNDFLNIGVGARAMAMGNAQVAVAEDVTAAYWNPAGLAAQGAPLWPELSLMHAAYFANIANYNYGGFAMPIDSQGNQRFAATFIRIGVDNIPNTLQLIEPDGAINTEKIQAFSANSFATILSYAWRPPLRGLSLGANAKIIYHGAGRFGNAWGFGMDIGARYQYRKWRMGAVIKDLTNTFTAWSFNTETFEEFFVNTGNEVPQNSVKVTPPSARLGVARDFQLSRRVGLLAALDADMYFDGRRASLISGNGMSIDPHAGVELSYLGSNGRKIAFLRGGVYNIQYLEVDEDEAVGSVFPTLGAGFALKNIMLDYALSNVGDFSSNLYTHVVSLRISIR